MKFKATSDFRNTHKIKVDGRTADDVHIAKGDTFEADIQDKTVQPLLAQLAAAGRIVDEGAKEAWKSIDKEVAADKKKSEIAAETQK